MWGFTVDDALIPVRYARHLAAGDGWRFNLGGPATDGVTPLPWPLLLAPLARAPALDVLMRAKYVNLAAWTAAAALLGDAIGMASAAVWVRVGALLVVGLSVPIAAGAASGLETGIATALATTAAIVGARGRSLLAAALAGAVAALRPEMAVWALILAVALALGRHGVYHAGTSLVLGQRGVYHAGTSLVLGQRGVYHAGTSLVLGQRGVYHAGTSLALAEKRPRPAARLALGVALALAPFAACAAIRSLAFGRPAPLALLAKPSDLRHGAAYATVAALVTLTPLFAVSRAAWRGGPASALSAAAAGHFAAIVAVGGDWMPYARLAAPVAPSLALAFALSASRASWLSSAVRLAAAATVSAYVLAVAAPAGRGVQRDRAELIARARPLLREAKTIASVDVGWPSAATEAGIVDLAGLTDPEIAALPGGHTSKRVDAAMLLDRRVDSVLFYCTAPVDLAAWRDASFAHAVAARLAASDLFAERYAPHAFLPLGDRGAGYLLLRASASDVPAW
jgi:hypothetical protein